MNDKDFSKMLENYVEMFIFKEFRKTPEFLEIKKDILEKMKSVIKRFTLKVEK